MRIFITILFVLLFSVCCKQSEKGNLSKPDSSIIKTIKKAKPKKYIGKSLNEYLSNSDLNKYIKWLPDHEPPGRIYAITLSYSEKIWVEIIFTEIHHQKQFNENLGWDFELLKKEIIKEIKYSWEE